MHVNGGRIQWKCPACNRSYLVPADRTPSGWCRACENRAEGRPELIEPHAAPRDDTGDVLRPVSEFLKTVSLGWLASWALAVILIATWLLWFVSAREQYRYDHMNIRGSVYPVRIDRETGEAEILRPDGWSKARGPEQGRSITPVIPPAAPQQPVALPRIVHLPAESLSLLSGRIEHAYDTTANLHVYNGTSYPISYVFADVTVREKDGTEIFSRPFVFTVSSPSLWPPPAQPLTSTRFSCDIGIAAYSSKYLLEAKITGAQAFVTGGNQ